MSHREFYSDETMNNLTSWSSPKLLQDSSSFNVAYGTAAVLQNGEINTNGLPVQNGLANPNGTFNEPWYDDPEKIPAEQEVVYIATATCDNGKWSK